MNARRLLAVVVAAVAAALGLTACATAHAFSYQRLEGERLHVKRSAGHVIRDRRASHRRALQLDGRGSAHGRMTLRRAARVALRLRARSCHGSPRLVVKVGRSVVFDSRVHSRRWRTSSPPGVVGAGRHTVTARLANPLRRGGCRRAVLIDRLDFRHVTRTPEGTPAPPGPGTPGAPLPPGAHWTPGPGTTWQWQLTTPVDRSVAADVYDIDLFDNDAAVVSALHAQGRKAICYFSAGSYEPGRPDSGSFPAAVLGNELEGWPGERWLDIRQLDVLGPIMERRLDLCKQKGFDGVEPDNVDAYTNNSGFSLTPADQLRYNRFLADAAHARGLGVGLKNDLDQVPQLEPSFDFAVVEQCYEYGECGGLSRFVDAGKAVFIAEYSVDPAQFCAQARAAGFSAIRKRLELDAWRQSC